MRYESFYPFSQGQNQPSEQPFAEQPRNSFFGNPNPAQYRQENPAAIARSAPPNQFPFGLGNRGAQNRFPFGRGGQGAPNQPLGFTGGDPNQIPYGVGGALGGAPQQPSKMEQYLQTADRFLSTAQQFQPMVSKVAPMVQNIPALWKLYRGFQSTPSAGAAAGTAGAATQAVSRAAASSIPGGISQPRIFQPPF